MGLKKWVFLWMVAFSMLLSGCTASPQHPADEASAAAGEIIAVPLELETNEEILFTTPDFLVTSLSARQADGSYSCMVYKTDLRSQERVFLGEIEFVGVYSSDFVCTDPLRFYSCYAYDQNFYSADAAPGEQIRLIEFDLESDTLTTIYEFSASNSLLYLEPLNDAQLLIYDTGETSANAMTTGFSIFDLTQKEIVDSLYYDRALTGKPVVATCSDGELYVLVYSPSEESYQIEVLNSELEKRKTISLQSAEHLFRDPDDNLLTFQYMTVKDHTVLLTSFGMQSFVLQYEPASDTVTERYVGDRLTAWGEANGPIQGYGDGTNNYLIHFEDGSITEVADIMQQPESLSYRMYTFDGKTFVIKNTVENSGGPARIKENYWIVTTES